MTDEGVAALAKGCPQLKKLSLYDCKKVTQAGRAARRRGGRS